MDALERHLVRQTEQAGDFFWHRLRWRVLSEYLPRGRSFRLLDLGAGAGLLGRYVTREFPAATYLFSEPISELSRRLEATYGADANAGNSIPQGVDVVALLDVLEHQEDDRGFLEFLLDGLERGTILVMTVPALSRLWSRWDVALGHHRRYDRQSLARCIQGLPVETVELSYLFPELIPPALLRARKKRPVNAGPAVRDEALFPRLPKALNEALYWIGRASTRLRRWWPAGTSIVMVLRRT